MGAQSFHQYLEADRLRCTLAPSRAAVWRIKRTQIRLSAFSACTLANANLLDFHELKLFRAQEYETDEGPWDPISGGFTTACRAFSNMGMGIAELPTETLKALHIPSGPSRRQSQASVKNTLGRSKTLDVRDRSVVPTPPGQIQTSSDGENPLSKYGALPASLACHLVLRTLDQALRPTLIEVGSAIKMDTFPARAKT